MEAQAGEIALERGVGTGVDSGSRVCEFFLSERALAAIRKKLEGME